MRRSPSSTALAAAGLVVAGLGCGPPLRLHPDAERGCSDVTIGGQDDVAAAAGCRTVNSLTIKTGMDLDLKPLGRLETIKGALTIGPSVGLTEVALSRITSAGAIRIVSNGNLQRCSMPSLEHAGSIEIENNATLFGVAFPSLIDIGKLSIADNAELEAIDFAKLATATEVILDKNPKLTIVEGPLPALKASISPVPKSDPVDPSSETHD